MAVCLLPGTEVAFEKEVKYERTFSLFPNMKPGKKVARGLQRPFASSLGARRGQVAENIKAAFGHEPLFIPEKVIKAAFGREPLSIDVRVLNT